MIETLVTGLILAAVSGLTFVAYKHPSGFDKLANILHIAAVSILIGLTIWNIAIDKAHIQLMKLLQEGALDKAQLALDEISLPTGWIIATFLAFEFYILFLSYLPNLVKHDENK